MNPVWIRFAEGIENSCEPIILRSGVRKQSSVILSLYFDGAQRPLLFDFSDSSSDVEGLVFEVLSSKEGIHLQITISTNRKLAPVIAEIQGNGGIEVVHGRVFPALLSGTWRLQFPGSLPEGPFRLRVQFG